MVNVEEVRGCPLARETVDTARMDEHIPSGVGYQRWRKDVHAREDSLTCFAAENLWRDRNMWDLYSEGMDWGD